MQTQTETQFDETRVKDILAKLNKRLPSIARRYMENRDKDNFCTSPDDIESLFSVAVFMIQAGFSAIYENGDNIIRGIDIALTNQIDVYCPYLKIQGLSQQIEQNKSLPIPDLVEYGILIRTLNKQLGE
jgi:hypothetical protein